MKRPPGRSRRPSGRRKRDA